MTRVIHTGDTHIGYQQYHSPARRQDFLDAFEAVVADAIGDDVDAVVHAGDLFHDRRPELPDLLGTLSALRDLRDAGVPFLAVVGNHESTRRGQWLDLFENLGLATRLGADPHRIGDVAFYGLDHVPKSRRDELTYDFEPHDAEHAVLVSHGLFTPFAHADWETETVLAESSVAFDAVLLGDNHAPGTTEVDGTWVTYCGSTERASATERDDRGYNLVVFDEDVDIRRRSLETRPFVFASVDLAPGEGVERVREQVRQHDLEGAVVVVEITGEGEPVTPASVEEFATEAGALVARVTDRREVDEAAADLDVSFADPDDAVRERVREMGLSTAARDVDETVRASTVADSNVREAVKTHVDDLLAEDEGAFSPAEVEEPTATEADGGGEWTADGTEGADGDETAAEKERTDDTVADEAAADGSAAVDADAEEDPDADADADTTATTDEDTPTESASGDAAGDDAVTDDPTAADEPTTEDATADESTTDEQPVDDPSEEPTPAERSEGDDGQVSMEDFL
jgi:DNA repair exonuclease SbcCD nuclease subunit